MYGFLPLKYVFSERFVVSLKENKVVGIVGNVIFLYKEVYSGKSATRLAHGSAY